ncbi:hypothetical protein E2562_039148 [Oryza meyeriana var. granulata]|uniref:Uncharacterized protein n=1 Tax=Oryza meyeriana var. granulata TaxID=110450 RepID=A0A6G1FH27_9ORYZ|nr:hypothetical protein E2562_039148 [Oryza meyeriana var. granulata]
MIADRANSSSLLGAIDHILEAKKNNRLTPENVIYIVAAIETTLWSIEWVLAEVVNHPVVQSKVRAKFKGMLSDDEPITESNIHKMPYLQAVIKETLRLHSPIPLLVPHMNLEAKLTLAASTGGYTIPKGSKVVVNTWWLANNPKLWEKLEEFRPERFLEKESGMDATVGARWTSDSCPSVSAYPRIILVLPILALIIEKLVMSFEMVPPPGLEKLDVSEKLTVTPILFSGFLSLLL